MLIRVEEDYLPGRWYAIDDNSYEPGNSVGIGLSPIDAARDLLDQLEELEQKRNLAKQSSAES